MKLKKNKKYKLLNENDIPVWTNIDKEFFANK